MCFERNNVFFVKAENVRQTDNEMFPDLRLRKLALKSAPEILFCILKSLRIFIVGRLNELESTVNNSRIVYVSNSEDKSAVNV